MQKDVPMELPTAVKKTELTCVKATHKRASRADAKEEVPKHAGEESLESFSLTTCTVQTLAERHK